MSLGLRRGTVFVEPHKAEWEVIAADTISKLHSILQDTLVDAQHIGSTSIKGICAKPIIDIVISEYRETYTASKSELIGEIIAKARCWREGQKNMTDTNLQSRGI